MELSAFGHYRASPAQDLVLRKLLPQVGDHVEMGVGSREALSVVHDPEGFALHVRVDDLSLTDLGIVVELLTRFRRYPARPAHRCHHRRGRSLSS